MSSGRKIELPQYLILANRQRVCKIIEGSSYSCFGKTRGYTVEVIAYDQGWQITGITHRKTAARRWTGRWEC
jgi:hypothetical protein